jgi:hypothetical protein
VVRHERIGNELSRGMITILSKTPKEESIVLRFEEYLMTVIATVVDMVIVVGKELHR